MVCRIVQGTTHAGGAGAELNWPWIGLGKFIATIVGILKAARDCIDTCGTKRSIATSLKMPRKAPSLDMFVAAIHEFRNAVADPGYNVTTARERLALTKGLNFDSQLVEKTRDIIIDIDKELFGTFQESGTFQEKKIHRLQTMGYVEYMVFGKSESNKSMPAITNLTTSVPGDKEHDMLIEGATIDKGKEKRVKRALNDVVNDKGMNKAHNRLIEGATIEKGKEKQSEPVVEGPKKKKLKGKSKKNKMPIDNGKNGKATSKENDDFVEGSIPDKGKGKENELLLEGSATYKGKIKEIGLPPAKHEVQGEESNDDDPFISQGSLNLIREAKDVVLGPISDDEDDEVSRVTAEPDSTGQDAHDYDPMMVEMQKESLIAFAKIHRLLRYARHQTATPCQLDLFCRFVEDPLFFEKMSETTEELRWNWYV